MNALFSPQRVLATYGPLISQAPVPTLYHWVALLRFQGWNPGFSVIPYSCPNTEAAPVLSFDFEKEILRGAELSWEGLGKGVFFQVHGSGTAW